MIALSHRDKIVRQLLLQRFARRVQFRFRHFPLSPIHPYAKHACARHARCEERARRRHGGRTPVPVDSA